MPLLSRRCTMPAQPQMPRRHLSTLERCWSPASAAGAKHCLAGQTCHVQEREHDVELEVYHAKSAAQMKCGEAQPSTASSAPGCRHMPHSLPQKEARLWQRRAAGAGRSPGRSAQAARSAAGARPRGAPARPPAAGWPAPLCPPGGPPDNQTQIRFVLLSMLRRACMLQLEAHFRRTTPEHVINPVGPPR